MTKLKFILPLLLILAAAVWWLMPHESDEETAYYIAVFCAISHQDEQQLAPQMQKVIEGSNSDYALQKNSYKPALGSSVIGRWQQLTPDAKQRAAEDSAACQELLKR